MTEAEWQDCDDTHHMCVVLGDRLSERKVRLVACAYCRTLWAYIVDERSRKAVEAAEAYADQELTLSDLQAAMRAAWDAEKEVLQREGCEWREWNAARAAAEAAGDLASVYRAFVGGDGRQQALLRDIGGNPFHPVVLCPAVLAWNSALVVRLAQAAYDERQLPAGTLAPERLAVLVDALQEAGCDDADILGHLHGPGPHCRGCWVVDALLEKE